MRLTAAEVQPGIKPVATSEAWLQNIKISTVVALYYYNYDNGSVSHLVLRSTFSRQSNVRCEAVCHPW